MNTDAPDRVILRKELKAICNVSSETVRRWMKEGRLPALDVSITHRTQGWRLSTLQSVGIGLV